MSSHRQTGPGRRTVVHDFPFAESNNRFSEDLGSAPKEFSFVAEINNNYPIPGEYWLQRNLLEWVLKTTKKGFLTHKWSGLVLSVAQLAKPTITESDDELGIVKFQLSFSQTTDNFYPNHRAATANTVNSFVQPVVQNLLNI
jgi:hypothetical protein